MAWCRPRVSTSRCHLGTLRIWKLSNLLPGSFPFVSRVVLSHKLEREPFFFLYWVHLRSALGHRGTDGLPRGPAGGCPCQHRLALPLSGWQGQEQEQKLAESEC